VVKGVHNGFGAGFSVLGDHFSPILALLAPLAPLYWFYSGPQTLICAQAMLFALAAFPLFAFTCHPKRGKDGIDDAGVLGRFHGVAVHDAWGTI
jgi:hypothetical protein